MKDVRLVSTYITNDARQIAENSRLLMDGNKEMEQMVSAMGGIKTASDSIAKIIKTIEDIASNAAKSLPPLYPTSNMYQKP